MVLSQLMVVILSVRGSLLQVTTALQVQHAVWRAKYINSEELPQQNQAKLGAVLALPILGKLHVLIF